MEKNKAPGPDGFPTEFFQKNWEILKVDLLNMFTCFHKGDLPVHHLNYGNVIPLPGKRERNSNSAVPTDLLVKR